MELKYMQKPIQTSKHDNTSIFRSPLYILHITILLVSLPVSGPYFCYNHITTIRTRQHLFELMSVFTIYSPPSTYHLVVPDKGVHLNIVNITVHLKCLGFGMTEDSGQWPTVASVAEH